MPQTFPSLWMFISLSLLMNLILIWNFFYFMINPKHSILKTNLIKSFKKKNLC